MELTNIHSKIYIVRGLRVMPGYDLSAVCLIEQGVAMLSSVLKSKKALQMNIAIIRAFVAIRQYALNYSEIASKLGELEQQYNRQFADVYKL